MRRSEKQPGWVPDLVWYEYQKSADYLAWIKSSGGDIQTATEAEIFSKIIHDERCGDVWGVIHSRMNDSTLDERDHLRNIPFHRFLWEAKLALSGPSPDSFISAVERKERGAKIAKLAKQLSRELMYLANKGQPPPEISGPLGDLVHGAYEAHTFGVGTEGPQWASDAMGRMKAGLVVHDLFFREGARNVLATLDASARAWAKTKPYAHHAGGRDRMCRDYFIRKMTDFFHSNFGRPQRRLVVELTRLLTGHEVTERDVTRIAPVKRRPAQTQEKSPSLRSARKSKTI
ncbi:hypothetical protein [Rhodanobacter sp. C05]|uniref:hypothetical protein n=1 Tax=Rhodanobacter sp. C05 TaxID=1945855 RepID=UPI00098516D4|nr:hypothetical protein [Rhodanobacter sp. C05]OOG42015.1 hypothetical protein B0E51_05520 [Rhodanobacter sp. C05]